MKRMSRILLLSLLALSTTAVLAQTSGSSGVTNYGSQLTGSNVIGGSGTNGGGSGNGFGFVGLSLDALNNLTVHSGTSGLGADSGINGFSLYQGNAGQNGNSPLMTFDSSTNRFSNGSFSSTGAISAALAAQIRNNPSNYYVQINTNEYPTGAVRGQLGSSDHQVLTGTLLGSNVVGGGANGNGSGNFVLSVRDSSTAGAGNMILDYDISTQGMGSSFSGFSLGSGTSGSGATSLFNFGSGSTGNNGRVTGSTTISRDLWNQMWSNPSGFSLTVNGASSGTNSGSIRGQLNEGTEIFLPIAGSAQGANGTSWKTDVTMFNGNYPNSSNSGKLSIANNADVNGRVSSTMQWYPSGTSSNSAQATFSSQMNARNTTTTRNATNSWFPGSNGLGAIRIITDEKVHANSRIYDDQSNSGRGTTGQWSDGMSRDEAYRQGTMASVANSSSTRTNVGFFNPSSDTVAVHLTLFDENGTQMGSRDMALGPWQHTQMPMSGAGGVFNTFNGNMNGGSLSFLAGANIFVYGSSIDNQSGDSSMMTPYDEENSSSTSSSNVQ